MTEIVLGFVVEEALRKVLSCITEEIKLAWGLDVELNRLRDSLSMVRDLLQDAEEQQMLQMAVRRWLKKIKVWASTAEDLLDELAYEVVRRKVETDAHAGEMGSFFKFSTGIHFAQKTAFHIKMAHRVRRVSESLDAIKNEAFVFGLRVTSADRNSSRQLSWDPVTDSIVDHPIVAREAEVSKIVNLLSGCHDQQALTVVAIVGMGGIGKTTVAKLVCQEAMEKKLFDVKMWVCVSTDLDDQRVLTEMLQTLNKSAGGITNKEAILQHLAEELEEKSFLLVLDNVWDEQTERWGSLKSRLSSINKKSGNAIVVTTRSQKVAFLMETSPHYECKLNVLSDDECWSIIRERVSGDARKSIPSDLESLGKEIASKCNGLPLAARVLGGTMSRNTTAEEWLSIKNSNVLNVSASEVSVESILRLSFDRLPFHLKPCVAYCSIFPRGVFLWKDELIQHWISDGLVDSTVEETGEKYFNELLHGSFLLDVRHDAFGKIQCARMHDLVHELVLSISKSDMLTLENLSAGSDVSHIQHLNVLPVRGPGAPVPVLLKGRTKALRTLFAASSDVFYDSFKFKSLRVLTLKGPNVKSLPASIGKLKHLRFVDVSHSEITALPKSITKLYNLQFLHMFECKLLEKLPRRLKDLVSLRCITFSYEKQMPSEVSRLTNLRWLSFFVVGPDLGGNIQELEGLNELTNDLAISNLELVRDEEEARKANLQRKRKIMHLGLAWTSERDTLNYNDENVLEGLQPFKDLKSLVIKNYLGEKFPSWLLTMKVTGLGGDCCSLDNLMGLKLEGCRRCGQLPRLGHLRLLKSLVIVGLDNVKYMGNEFYGSTEASTSCEWRLFPALEIFSIDSMKNLVKWMAPTTFDVFPCLKMLRISKCPKLKSIPISHISSLVELRIEDCDEFGELLFDEAHPLTSLRLLWIKSCANFASCGSVQGLTSLQDLKFSKCYKLESLPRGLKYCSSLSRLYVHRSLKLTSVPDDILELASLKSLHIFACPNLKNVGHDFLLCLTQLRALGISCDNEEALNSIQYMPSLDWLTIEGRNEVKSLPHQLRSLTVLKTLHIVSFNGVEALPDWLGELSSLEYLEIWDCENLKYLPSAAAIRGLSRLKFLHIAYCRFLGVSCAKESGSEWSKISHIPKIVIDKVILKDS